MTRNKKVAQCMEEVHRQGLLGAHSAEHLGKLIMARIPAATIERWLDERRAAERAAKPKKH